MKRRANKRRRLAFSHEILESRDLLAADCGVIEGFKWDDANGNGLFDADESRLAGWTIYVDENNNGELDGGELSAVTDSDGEYRIEGVPAGTVVVREIQQDGWTQTSGPSFSAGTTSTEGSVEVAVFSNGNFVDMTSGGSDAEAVNVRESLEQFGHVVTPFVGTTADDISAATEAEVILIPELENGNLSDALNDEGEEVLRSFVSDGGSLVVQGEAFLGNDTTFLNQVFGFSLSAVQVSGSSSLQDTELEPFNSGPNTLPANDATNGFSLSSLPDSATSIYDNGSTASVVVFDVGSGSITYLGWDWFDAAPRGNQDGGWLDVLDIAVRLDGGLTLEPGETKEVNFGNRLSPGGISGQKFHDLNGDGVFDEGEPGLAGWTIYLDENNNEALDPGELSTVTGTDGSYEFTGLPFGTSYVVREVQQAGWRQTSPTSGTELDELLISLQDNASTVSDLVPNRFNFSDGEFGTSISDGGSDMFDGGNILNTNRASLIEYTNNTVVESSTQFGPDSSYLTWKSDGLFALAASDIDVESFSISGNNGADGSGIADGAELETSINGQDYRIFVKRVHSAFDPSINSIIIVPSNDESISQTFATNTNDGAHDVSGLEDVDSLFYLLVASSNGGLIADAEILEIAEAFVELAPGTSEGVGTEVSITPGTFFEGVDFGNQAEPGGISGQKFYDLDSDGVFDSGEPGLAGWTIYLDLNDNGEFDPSEPSTITGSGGHYAFTELPAETTYVVREVPQPGWLQTAPGGADVVLDELLVSLQDSASTVSDLVPNRFNFSDGEFGTSINDGGNDMFDGGNTLNTNLASFIEYTNNTVVESSTQFGPDSSYLTWKSDGLFALAASDIDIESFSISGNNGADGGGTADGAELETRLNGQDYRIFVKRVHSAFDPSINSIIIVPSNDESISQTFATNTDDGAHDVTGLEDVDSLFYLLVASSNGEQIVDADILDIAEAFVELVPGSGDNEVTIPPGAFIEGVNFGNAQGISLDFASSTGSFEIPAGETVQVSVNVTNTPRAIDSFEIDFSDSAIGANGLQLSNWAFGSEDLIAIDGTLDSEAGDNGVSAVFDASQGGPLTLGTFDLTVPSTSTASEFLLTLNELSSSFLSGTTQLGLFDFGSELITFGPAAEIGAPEVVNVTVNDGLDASVGDDFPSWQTQRSLLRTINVQFSEAVSGISSSTVRLTSLGLDGSESIRVPLSSGQLNHSGDALSIILFDVPDGVLQLEILPSVSDLFGNSLDGNGDSTGGDAFVLVGDASNHFYQLTGDFDGDGVVTDTDVNLVASSLGMTTEEVPGFLDVVSDGVIATTDLNTIRPLEGNRVDFPLQGDYDRDGRLDAEDIDLLFAASSEAEPATEFDLDRNGVVDRADVDYWLNNLAQTTFADLNLDGETGFRDFLILSANFGLSDNVGWGNGDLNGDGAVGFADFLLLSNTFEEPTVTPEPEPGARFVVDFEELGAPEDQVNLVGGVPFSLGDAPFNFQVAADLSATWVSSETPFMQQIFGADTSAFFGFAERPVTLTHDTNEAFALDSFVFGPFALAMDILGDPPVELSVTGVFSDGTSETLEFSVETATQVEIGWTNLEAVSLSTADNVTAVGIDDLILRI